MERINLFGRAIRLARNSEYHKDLMRAEHAVKVLVHTSMSCNDKEDIINRVVRSYLSKHIAISSIAITFTDFLGDNHKVESVVVNVAD